MGYTPLDFSQEVGRDLSGGYVDSESDVAYGTSTTIEWSDDAYENLATLLEKGIERKDLVAVRMIDNGYTNNDGNRMYACPVRPTIHFALNHVVDLGGKDGNTWDSCHTAVIVPFEKLMDANQGNFVGGTAADTYLVGFADLEGHEIMQRGKNESYDSFKNRIQIRMEEMGYPVLPAGEYCWGSKLETTKAFGDFLDSLGDLHFGPHKGSVFDTAENCAMGYLGYGEENDAPKITNMAMYRSVLRYLHEFRAEYAHLIDERTGEMNFNSEMPPGTPEGVPSYEEWFKANMEGDCVVKGRLGHPAYYNGTFLRQTYLDAFPAVIELEDCFRTVELRHKRNETEDDKRDIAQLKAYIDRVRTFPERFAPHLEEWKAHWDEVQSHEAQIR